MPSRADRQRDKKRVLKVSLYFTLLPREHLFNGRVSRTFLLIGRVPKTFISKQMGFGATSKNKMNETFACPICERMTQQQKLFFAAFDFFFYMNNHHSL